MNKVAPLACLCLRATFFLLTAVVLGWASAALGGNWSTTEVQLLHGDRFREFSNPEAVAKGTLTLTNASGFDWGGSYFFVDYLKSDGHDDHDEEFYGEVYLYPSLSHLTGRSLKAGILKDVSLTLGVNYGEKTNGANPRALLPGLTFHLNLPGFAFFDLGVNAYLDHSLFNGQASTCNGETWQITPVWKLPFRLGGLGFSFEGYADFTGAHGTCVRQVLSQPQLRLDVGKAFGRPGQVHLGIEYQYWHNKFGIRGLNDRVPQALLVWGF
jgi:nucleoside-specific outer membrane channel protein Tsx